MGVIDQEAWSGGWCLGGLRSLATWGEGWAGESGVCRSGQRGGCQPRGDTPPPTEVHICTQQTHKFPTTELMFMHPVMHAHALEHIHTCTNTCGHTCAHVYAITHRHEHVHSHTSIHMHRHTCAHIHRHAQVLTHAHTGMNKHT